MAEQDVAAQVRVMRSVRDFERLKAAGAFEEYKRGLTSALIARHARDSGRQWVGAAAVALVVFAAGLLLTYVAFPHSGVDWRACAWLSLVCLAMGLTRCHETPLQRSIIGHLDVIDGVRALRELLEVVRSDDPAARVVAAPLLVRALACVDGRNGFSFGRAERRYLVEILTSGPPGVAVEAMRALARLRDASCLSQMERLAEEKGMAKKHADVWQAAKDALPDLEAEQARQRQAATLLRPADAPADATLLRPADGAPHGDDATLLRPAEEPAREVEAHG